MRRNIRDVFWHFWLTPSGGWSAFSEKQSKNFAAGFLHVLCTRGKWPARRRLVSSPAAGAIFTVSYRVSFVDAAAAGISKRELHAFVWRFLKGMIDSQAPPFSSCQSVWIYDLPIYRSTLWNSFEEVALHLAHDAPIMTGSPRNSGSCVVLVHSRRARSENEGLFPSFRFTSRSTGVYCARIYLGKHD